MATEEMKFDETDKTWLYKVNSYGCTVYGRGQTQEEAKKDFEKNCEDMWG